MSGNIHTLGGGRSLGGDGDAEPLPAAWANRNTQPRIGRIGGPSSSTPARGGGGRVASLRDFANTPGGSSRGPRRDDDDEDGPQDFFAGGERSGLSVQNPAHGEARGSGGAANQVRDILRKAAEGSRSMANREPPRSSAFFGTGNTLGSDESESQTVPDPNARPDAEDTAIRNITFWRTGFTIQDGPLLLYSDPESAELLEAIQQGLAPPEALNVRVGQPVELRVAKRLDEDYVPPPPGPFAGSGNRLGSPVPPAAQPAAAAASTSTATASSSAAAPPSSFEVDLTAPMTSIQIRLADGTRIVSRMNLTHTIADIRNFINASRPGTSTRPYTIQTTLPVKVLDDETQTIEAAGLKNSVVVQRWL
ncbi:SubName: Full=Related to SHP1-potential regulatory subunit for Glc7p {ECO:0000313/EMBL:CCA75778.1} [Serendipita indica DSM 11827]|nr:SubName: Full=Related to SHP1-potential regulatory subunit for Glc7p {ECO:0000313/EMBL:CCA75778.1} [Serendipita indica DSM 11827]